MYIQNVKFDRTQTKSYNIFLAQEVWERIKSIRTAFTKARNKKAKSGSGAKDAKLNERQQRLLKRLTFLIPHLRGYKSDSTMNVCIP